MNAKNLQSDERGFLLVVTMIMLVVLTIVGIASLDNSVFEAKIASNDRLAKVSFNLADGSVYLTSKVVAETMRTAADPNVAVIEFEDFTAKDGSAVSHTANDFYKRVMGFKQTQIEDPLIDPPLPDFQIKPKGAGNPETVEVFLVARKAKMIAGGGAEFGAGAAGAGVGSGGAGAAVTADIDVDAYSLSSSKASLSARFIKVLGTAGGL